MNKEWHEQNRMPRRSTLEARVAWHAEHGKHCACRPVPESLIGRMPDGAREAGQAEASTVSAAESGNQGA